jgi:hypothetical protein
MLGHVRQSLSPSDCADGSASSAAAGALVDDLSRRQGIWGTKSLWGRVLTYGGRDRGDIPRRTEQP